MIGGLKLKILVLDDDQGVLKAVKTILDRSGYEVNCCDNAAVAVEMLKGVKYDLVLFDYRMPGQDGIWFLQNANLPSCTKALLMVACGTRDFINRMFDLGACGYMMKPFTADDLLRNVEFHGRK
jgi:DNA-binding response OmpR family regulator